MTGALLIPWARHPDISLVRVDENGQYLLANQLTGALHSLGEMEYFLLSHLDGRQTTASLCAAFAAHFGQPLSGANLEEFVDTASEHGLLAGLENGDF